MKHLANSIANFYVRKKIIDVEYEEVYQYGLELILNDVVTFSLILITAHFLWNVKFAIVFLLVFCITRVFCGGFHASKTYICRCTMLLTFCCVSTIAKYLQKNNLLTLIMILLIQFLVLIKLIPVKHPNKSLTKKEKQKNKKRGIISYICFSVVSITAFWIGYLVYSYLIALSLSAVTVLAIIGKILNERRKSQ